MFKNWRAVLLVLMCVWNGLFFALVLYVRPVTAAIEVAIWLESIGTSPLITNGLVLAVAILEVAICLTGNYLLRRLTIRVCARSLQEEEMERLRDIFS